MKSAAAILSSGTRATHDAGRCSRPTRRSSLSVNATTEGVAAYAAAKGRTGFSSYRISTGLGGRGGRSGRSPNPRIFEEFL